MPEGSDLPIANPQDLEGASPGGGPQPPGRSAPEGPGGAPAEGVTSQADPAAQIMRAQETLREALARLWAAVQMYGISSEEGKQIIASMHRLSRITHGRGKEGTALTELMAVENQKANLKARQLPTPPSPAGLQAAMNE